MIIIATRPLLVGSSPNPSPIDSLAGTPVLVWIHDYMQRRGRLKERMRDGGHGEIAEWQTSGARSAHRLTVSEKQEILDVEECR
jgi:hypothetical protein